jgi:hypothetical protein
MGCTANPLDTWALSSEVEQQGYEVDDPSPYNAKVKNAYSYTSSTSYIFMVKVKGKVGPVLNYLKHHAMKIYGGVEV